MKEVKELNKWRDIPMFINRKTQYCKDANPFQIGVQIIMQVQCNPNQKVKKPKSFFFCPEQCEKLIFYLCGNVNGQG